LKKVNIKSKEDIENILKLIITNEEFEICDVEPFEYKIVLDGGRYKNFDPKIINSDIAKIVLSIQDNYDKLLIELEEKYDIKIDEEKRQLHFSFEKGSGVIETMLESGVLKNLESKHLMYVLVVALLSFTSFEAYTSHLESVDKEIQSQKEIQLKKLDYIDRNSERESVGKMYDSLADITKSLVENKTLQDSVNKPKRDILSTLNDNEYVKVSKDKKLTNKDKRKYNYKKPNVDTDDIEVITTEIHKIETQNFVKKGKLFKLNNISKPANSELLEASKRIDLMKKAENKEDVKVKIKTIIDGVTKKVKSVYIVDYIKQIPI